MNRIIQYIKGRFSRLEKLGKWALLWRSWLEVTIIAYAIANVVNLVYPTGARTDLDGLSSFQFVMLVTITGPLFETIVFQSFPLEITATLGFRRSFRMITSIILFAVMHYSVGLPTVIGAGIVGGFYFAFMYERWRKESLFVAVGMTFLLHSSFNLVGVLSMLLFP